MPTPNTPEEVCFVLEKFIESLNNGTMELIYSSCVPLLADQTIQVNEIVLREAKVQSMLIYFPDDELMSFDAEIVGKSP